MLQFVQEMISESIEAGSAEGYRLRRVVDVLEVGGFYHQDNEAD